MQPLWKDNRGEKHPSAKLTWEEVREMRRMHMDGYAIAEIASRFRKISMSRVKEIIAGRAWRSDPADDHNNGCDKSP